MRTTSATAQVQRIINKGDIAPFHGVLVGEITYRQMTSDIRQGEILKIELEKIKNEPVEKPNKALIFSSGAAFGFIATVLLIGYAGRR